MGCSFSLTPHIHSQLEPSVCCEGCASPSFTNVCSFRRAPVLVALALIECGMKYEDAIQFIRQYVQFYFSVFLMLGQFSMLMTISIFVVVVRDCSSDRSKNHTVIKRPEVAMLRRRP